jgi:hypothetical protein
MDTPKSTTEIVAEAPTTETQALPQGIEASPVAEQIPSSPVQPTPAIPAQTGSQTLDIGSFSLTQDDDKITPDEVADLTSSDILSADTNWVGKVRQIIQDDEGKPFKEEQDAEKLNEEYMKSRFNIDVDESPEEK